MKLELFHLIVCSAGVKVRIDKAELPFIVLAAVDDREKLKAILEVHPTGVMTSFMAHKSHPRVALLNMMTDQAKHLVRMCDSGLFTFLKKHQITGNIASRLNSYRYKTLDTNDMIPHFQAYYRFLKEYHEAFDYVIEVDCQMLCGGGSQLPFREQLLDLVGQKLIPVWHPIDGLPAYEALASEYPYIAIGSTQRHTRLSLRHLTFLARKYNTHVHGLGIGAISILKHTAFSSADSTKWLRPIQKGRVYLTDDKCYPMGRKVFVSPYAAYVQEHYGIKDVQNLSTKEQYILGARAEKAREATWRRQVNAGLGENNRSLQISLVNEF